MSNQIEWRHLRYFLAVAHELHFRKAAEKLFISQPGLSRQIKQLEEQLGVKLFDRENKKVSLTPAGNFLKVEAAIHLKNIESVLKHTQLLDQGLEGEIKIAYVGSAMQNVIPELLIKARKKYPTIRFVLKEMDNTTQVEALLKNHIDLGFLRLNDVPQELIVDPVFKDTFSLVIPKKHPLKKKAFNSILQLKEESFILFEKSYSPAYYERVMSIFEDAGFSPKISHSTVHATTIFKLVENHFGISIIPTALTKGHKLKVRFIELKNINQRAILSVCYRKKNRNPILKKFMPLIAK